MGDRRRADHLAPAEDGTSGTGVNLDGALGVAGASDTNGDGSFTAGELQAFSTDTDTSGVKITSIGFLVQDTTDQSATIDFDVTVTDADGDTQTESITVNVGDPVAPANLPPLSLNSEEQLQKTAANSNTLTLAAAVAAAGMGNRRQLRLRTTQWPSRPSAGGRLFGHEFVASFSSEEPRRLGGIRRCAGSGK